MEWPFGKVNNPSYIVLGCVVFLVIFTEKGIPWDENHHHSLPFGSLCPSASWPVANPSFWGLDQCLFLVPLKGGIGSIFHHPEGQDYKWYISGIFPAIWGIICHLPPFRGTRNNH